MRDDKGKDFEVLVASLLQSSGYRVEREQLLGSKRIDILLRKYSLGRHEVWALECKDYHAVLTRDALSKIVASYVDLTSSALVDGLLIVTRAGVSPAAAALIRGTSHLRHMTLAELEWNVIEFDTYLTALVDNYGRANISKYYVPPKTTTGQDLNEAVMTWLTSADRRPLTILGSYGLGKTTFARHLTANLAKRALDDHTERRPILIPLGELNRTGNLGGRVN